MSNPKNRVSIGFRAAQLFADGLDTVEISDHLSTDGNGNDYSEGQIYNTLAKAREDMHQRGLVIRARTGDDESTHGITPSP